MSFLKYCPILIMVICLSNEQECSIKKVSCNEVKTAEGFEFSHGISGGSTVSVTRNQTVIARGQLSPPSFTFTSDVRSMDNSSVVTATCEDLKIHITHRDERYISESCVDFRVIDKVKLSDLQGEVQPTSGNIKCAIKNTSCTEIKMAEGFKFSHRISGGNTVTAIQNDTVIGRGLLNPPSFSFTPDVRSMDNSSVVTATCEDLTIEVTHRNGQHVTESCVKFRITDDAEPPDPEVTPHLYLIICGCVLGGLVLGVCLHYIHWRRKQKKKNRVTTFPAYMKWVVSCSLIKKSGQEPRPDGVVEGEDGDSASQPDGSSIDPEAGGGTAHTLSLNHNGGIQPSTNGCISHSVVASSSNDQTVNQNVTDDPGGTNDNEGKCRKMHSGRTLGGQSPEGHENEDEPLLLKPRFEGLVEQQETSESCLKSGEAVAWWTCNGSDPAPTGRYSTAPDVDMDSSNIQHEIELVNL